MFLKRLPPGQLGIQPDELLKSLMRRNNGDVEAVLNNLQPSLLDAHVMSLGDKIWLKAPGIVDRAMTKVDNLIADLGVDLNDPVKFQLYSNLKNSPTPVRDLRTIFMDNNGSIGPLLGNASTARSLDLYSRQLKSLAYREEAMNASLDLVQNANKASSLPKQMIESALYNAAQANINPEDGSDRASTTAVAAAIGAAFPVAGRMVGAIAGTPAVRKMFGPLEDRATKYISSRQWMESNGFTNTARDIQNIEQLKVQEFVSEYNKVKEFVKLKMPMQDEIVAELSQASKSWDVDPKAVKDKWISQFGRNKAEQMERSFHAVRESLNRTGDAAEELAIRMKGDSAGRSFKKRKDYFPMMMYDDALAGRHGLTGTLKDQADKLIADGKAVNFVDAMQQLDYKYSNPRIGTKSSLGYSRSSNGQTNPDDYMSPADSLINYLKGSWDDIVTNRELSASEGGLLDIPWGKTYDEDGRLINTNTMSQAVMGDIKDLPLAIQRQVNNDIDKLYKSGLDPVDVRRKVNILHDTLKAYYSNEAPSHWLLQALNQVNTFKLGRAQLKNFFQQTNTIAKTGEYVYAQALGEKLMDSAMSLFTDNPSVGKELAEAVGAVQDKYVQKALKVNNDQSFLGTAAENFMKWTGFNWTEEFNREMSARAAGKFLDYAKSRLSKGTADAELYRGLSDLGVDPKQLVRLNAIDTPKLYEAMRIKAGRRMETSTQFGKSKLENSMFKNQQLSQHAGLYKAAMQFKEMALSQSINTVGYLIKEAKNGNTKPLQRMMIMAKAYAPMMGGAKNFLAGYGIGTPIPKGDEEKLKTDLGSFMAMNVLGLVGDQFNVSNSQQAKTTFLPPSASDAIDTVVAASKSYKTQNFRPIVEQGLKDVIPLFPGLINKAANAADYGFGH